MRKWEKIAVCAGALLLASCALNTPAPDARIYTLSAPALSRVPSSPSVTLAVAAPRLAPGLDSERIALLRDVRQFDYYAGAKWPESLSQVLESVLVKALENARQARTVTGSGAMLPAEYVLLTEWRDFQAEYGGKADAPPAVHLRLTATLLRQPGRQVVETFVLEESRPASENTLAAVNNAMDSALTVILTRLSIRLTPLLTSPPPKLQK